MKKEEIILGIKKTGLMAIVRVETVERGYEIAQGCLDGGVNVLEISYTNNNAGEVISAWSARAPSWTEQRPALQL